MVLFLEDEGGIKNLYVKYFLLFLSYIAIGFLDLRIGFNLFFMTGVPALFLFLRYRLNKFKLEPLIYAPLPAFLLTVGVILFFTDQRELFLQYITKNIDEALKSIENYPLDEISSNYAYLLSHKKEIALMTLYLIPSITFVYTSFLTLLAKNVYIVRNAIIEPFRVPFHFVWLLILGGFTILSDTLEVKVISYNTFIIFTYLYFIQGSGVITTLLIRKRLMWLRLLILFLILIYPYVVVVIAVIGLFDNWFNFGTSKENKDDSQN